MDAERLVARLRCAQGDASAPLDRVLEATVDRQEKAPDLRDHDPRLVERLSTFDVGHPTPKLWLFDETTGWPLCPGPALRRVPSAREVGASALSGSPTKQSYLRAFLEELLRRDAEDLAAELHQHGAVVGESATTRRARLDAALDALGAGIQLRGVQGDGSLVFHGGGTTRELTEISSTERRAVLVVATAIHVDLSRAIVIADGLVDGPDAARWVSALRSLCPHGQLVVTSTRPGPWMDDGVVIELGARR